jgi:tRNA threonylcarbamoyladenosine biosynthesis protein TsaE
VTESVWVADEAALRELAAAHITRWRAGDLVLLHGPLGAGKTTFVRGALGALGVISGVRSPTFNLVQLYDTHPPVLHADLYRVSSGLGLGIEDELDRRLCFIEWPERGADLLDGWAAWQVWIDFDGEGRQVRVIPPGH